MHTAYIYEDIYRHLHQGPLEEVNNVRISYKAVYFPPSWEITGFSKRTLLIRVPSQDTDLKHTRNYDRFEDLVAMSNVTEGKRLENLSIL